MPVNSQTMLEARLPEFTRPKGATDLIRIGSAADGGYVVSSSMLDAARFVVSFGLDDNWDFEADVCERLKGTGCICHAYDAGTSPVFLDAIGAGHRIASYRNVLDGRRAVHFRENVGRGNTGWCL